MNCSNDSSELFSMDSSGSFCKEFLRSLSKDFSRISSEILQKTDISWRISSRFSHRIPLENFSTNCLRNPSKDSSFKSFPKKSSFLNFSQNSLQNSFKDSFAKLSKGVKFKVFFLQISPKIN